MWPESVGQYASSPGEANLDLVVVLDAVAVAVDVFDHVAVDDEALGEQPVGCL